MEKAEQYPPVIIRLELLKHVLVPKRVRHGPHESATDDLPTSLSARFRQPPDYAVLQIAHIFSVYSSTAALKPGMSSSAGHC